MFKSPAAAFAPVPPTNPDDATKQALLAVVQVWLDRLQAMAVITSFFVSIDSMAYAFPYRDPDPTKWSSLDLLINASLGGAIIFHSCASILSYIASFVLIRYQLTDAENKEEATEQPSTPGSVQRKPDVRSFVPASADGASEKPWDAYTDLRCLVSVRQVRYIQVLCCGAVPRKLCPKRHPEAAAPVPASVKDDAVRKLKSMVKTLSRCHTLVTIMTQLGFLLALLGIVAYFWTGLPRALGIFATAVLGGCLFAMAVVIM